MKTTQKKWLWLIMLLLPWITAYTILRANPVVIATYAYQPVTDPAATFSAGEPEVGAHTLQTAISDTAEYNYDTNVQ